jgi:catechol 2,3-dioxygenase-like lactoylglutathione lyase family enzyme
MGGPYDLAMLDHLGIQCADVPKAAAFYDAVLATLGAGRIMDFGQYIGYGKDGKPDFWIGPVVPEIEPNRELHIAFVADDRATVRKWFDAAVGAGAEVLHEPREWPEYHRGYYGAFVRDPDGNNVEAVCHRPE